MPAYDFRCTECSTTFEVVRSASDASPVGCPECSAGAKRVFTPVGVVFKGSGFHTTDYRKGGDEGSTAKPSADAPSCPATKKDPGCAGCPAAEASAG